jgi:hypothetical protein
MISHDTRCVICHVIIMRISRISANDPGTSVTFPFGPPSRDACQICLTCLVHDLVVLHYLPLLRIKFIEAARKLG